MPNDELDLTKYSTLSAASTNISVAGNNNINWGSYISTTPYYTMGDLFNDIDNPLTKIILNYCSEKDLSSIITNIIMKKVSLDDNEVQKAIKYIISHRHVSEAFILTFLKFDNMDNEQLLDILKPHHYADIISGEYEQLALLVQLKSN